jgi:purine nucleosidase
MVGQPWGEEIPRKNEASDFIIETAKSYSAQNKLTIIALGALTNVATAMLQDTSIADKVVVYMLGCWYNTTTRAWNKSEFNIRNDLNAFDYLLNNKKVEMHIMSTTTALQLKVYKKVYDEKLSKPVPLFKQLINRWNITGYPQRILWDMAIVDAFLHPEWATQEEVLTPPENTQRKVFLYTDIDEKKMEEDFLNKLQLFEEKYYATKKEK